MDVERALINKILAEKSLGDVTDYGIRPDFFQNKTNRRVFQALLSHARDYSEVPSVRIMRKDFPTYQFTEVEESLLYLMDEVRKQHALALFQDSLNHAVTRYDAEDVDGVKAELIRVLGQVSTDITNTRDVDITQTVDKRLERYEALRHLDGGLRGIASGFPTIDRATQGFQPKQLTTMIGPPKAGKSTMLLIAAMTAHLLGLTPLFIGFEMTNEEQEERLDSIIAEVSHHRLRGGQLTDEEMKRLKKRLHMFENMKPFFFSNDTMSTTTLTGVTAKIQRYKPDIVLLDGVYMMDDEEGERKGTPQALTNITRGAKRICQNEDIPMIISTQVLEWKMDRKRGITSNSIGYSSSFAQDSDNVIGVERTDDEEIKKVKIVLSRNTPNVEVFVRWDWETGKFEEMETDPFKEEREGYEVSV